MTTYQPRKYDDFALMNDDATHSNGEGEPVDGEEARELDFTVQVDADSDLAVDADRAYALVTVTATAAGSAGGGAGRAARHAEILIMDRSRSMLYQDKIREAQYAACAAIDTLPDGVLLGVIAGSNEAERVFPPRGGLTAVDASAKTAAKRAVMNLRADGGTAIGRWLSAAAELFGTVPAAGVIRHAVLYSDGKNQHETRQELDGALSACTDRFVCDVRGLGDDWDYRELQHIADTLHGDATAVRDIANITDDFMRLVQRAQRLIVPRTYLRLRPDPRFEIARIEQARPVHADLTGQQQADGAAIDLPLGAWADETRLYRVVLRFDPGALRLGEEVRATPVELLAETVGGARTRRAGAPFAVRRGDVPKDETKRPESHTHLEKTTLLTVTMRACVDAWVSGQLADADAELDSAIRLALEIHDLRLRLLEKVAIIEDGRARLRPDVSDGEMQRLGLDSRKTGFPGEGRMVQPAGAGRRCGTCGEVTDTANAEWCENCGTPFDEQVPS